MASPELDRRAFLSALGVVAAAASLPSCRSSSAIHGRIVDASHARGHRLRDGGWPTTVTAFDEREVAIVGAGVAGLSAAWKLAKHGVEDVTVLELEDMPGGTARGGRTRVSACPWGAHYVPVPTRDQRTLCEFLSEIGVIRGFDARGTAIPVESHLLRAPDERLFHAGEWVDGLYPIDGASAEDRRQKRTFEEIVAALATRVGSDGRPWFTIPVANASRDPEAVALDSITMRRWLDDQGLTSPRLRWFVEYACRDDFGCLLDSVSAWAALHYFASRHGDDAAVGTHYLTWPEGNAFLVAHLARSCRELRTGALVVSVSEENGRGVVRYVDLATETLREVRARHVVCAVPRYVAARLVPAAAVQAPAFRYAPWVVANLVVTRTTVDRGFPLAWDNVIESSESLGYVVATHQLDRTSREATWTWYRAYCGADALASRREVFAATWEDWRDAVLLDLSRAHPDLRERVESIDVVRHGHAMIRPEPGFVFGEPRAAAAAPVGLVHFAGTDLGGLPIFEEAQWSGVRAAEEILTRRGVRFASSL